MKIIHYYSLLFIRVLIGDPFGDGRGIAFGLGVGVCDCHVGREPGLNGDGDAAVVCCACDRDPVDDGSFLPSVRGGEAASCRCGEQSTFHIPGYFAYLEKSMRK